MNGLFKKFITKISNKDLPCFLSEMEWPVGVHALWGCGTWERLEGAGGGCKRQGAYLGRWGKLCSLDMGQGMNMAEWRGAAWCSDG